MGTKEMKTFKEYLEDVKKSSNEFCQKCGAKNKKTMDNTFGTTFKCTQCGFKRTIQKNPETGEYNEDI